jgi:prepilin-type N-terminal cleavage/methylation domain-containing protein
MKKLNDGYTLIEMLIVVAIIGILASVVMVVINPGRQLAKARDVQRESDLFAILAAVYQYSTENSGELPDTDDDPETSNFPTSQTCIGTDATCFDLASAGEDDTIVPVFMPQIPVDPKTGNGADTGYFIWVDENDRLQATASGETRMVSETR